MHANHTRPSVNNKIKMEPMGASPGQIATAAIMRYNTNYTISAKDKQTLHQIVHSTDETGPFCNTPNKYRDFTASYDAKAQKELDRIAATKKN